MAPYTVWHAYAFYALQLSSTWLCLTHSASSAHCVWLLEIVQIVLRQKQTSTFTWHVCKLICNCGSDRKVYAYARALDLVLGPIVPYICMHFPLLTSSRCRLARVLFCALAKKKFARVIGPRIQSIDAASARVSVRGLAQFVSAVHRRNRAIFLDKYANMLSLIAPRYLCHHKELVAAVRPDFTLVAAKALKGFLYLCATRQQRDSWRT